MQVIDCTNRALKLVLGMLALLVFLVPSISSARLSQVYPTVSTTPIYSFSQPVFTGNYLESKKIYVHSEYSATTPSIRGLDANGVEIFNQPISSPNTQAVAIITDYVYTFGATQDTRVLQLNYNTASGYIQISSSGPVHNKNLNRAFTDPETSEIDGQILVTTTTGGKLYVFSNIGTTGTPAKTGTLALFNTASMDAVEYMPGGIAILVGGTASSFVIVYRNDLATAFSLPVVGNIVEIKRDKLSESSLVGTDQSLIDYAENTNHKLRRAIIDFRVQTLTEQASVTFPTAISNLVQFANVLYLAVISGNTVTVVTRTLYTSKYTLSLAEPVYTYSVAGTSNSNFLYSFSGVSSSSKSFLSISVDLNFCGTLNSDGSCSSCISGYQLNSSGAPNRCILQEEYPAKYGARGTTIDPCFDTACLSCLGNYLKCEQCPSGTFLNMVNFQCTTLDKSDFFGYDLTNSSVIRRCSDSQCLNCKQNYQVCQSCPVEYYNLVAGTCVKKSGELAVVDRWFDQQSGTVYFVFSQPMTVDVSNLLGNGLAVSVTDYKGDEFTDYSGVLLSISQDKKTVKATFGFKSTIYNATILFSQVANTSVFYGPTAYMSVSEEIQIQPINKIMDSTYYSILASETLVSLVYWGLMSVTLLLGMFQSPWLATSMMRAVSYCTIFVHLNGPILHSSDTLLDIIAKVSTPLFPRSLFRTSSPTAPPQNFMKRHFDYYSTDAMYNFGGSMLYFLVFTIPCLVLFWLKHSAINSVVARVKHNQGNIQETDISPGLISKSLLAKLVGPRFLLAVIDSCAPLLLQYSLLNILYVQSAEAGIFFTPLVMILIFGLAYCQFKFTFSFLEHQAEKILKSTEDERQSLTDKDNTTKVGDSCLNPSELADFSIDVPMKPSRGATREKRAVKKAETPVVRDEKSGLGSNRISLESWGYSREEMAVLEGSRLNWHEEIRLSMYPAMAYSMEGYTKNPTSRKSIMYYLPLLELLNQIVGMFVLVRFSMSGLIQVYILFGFELMLVGIYLRMRPFATRLQLGLVVAYKFFVLVIYSFKLWNFRNFDNETSRQSFLDNAVLVSVGCFLIYSVALGVFGAAQGIVVLLRWDQETRAERIRVVKLISKSVGPIEGSVSGLSNMNASVTIAPLQGSSNPEPITLAKKAISQDRNQIFPQPTTSAKKPNSTQRRRLIQETTVKTDLGSKQGSKVRLPTKPLATKSRQNKVTKTGLATSLSVETPKEHETTELHY